MGGLPTSFSGFSRLGEGKSFNDTSKMPIIVATATRDGFLCTEVLSHVTFCITVAWHPCQDGFNIFRVTLIHIEDL